MRLSIGSDFLANKNKEAVGMKSVEIKLMMYFTVS